MDYHFCGNFRRFHYARMMEGRPTEPVYQMMFSHLPAHIRLSGPVGLPPKKSLESLRLMQRQMDQRLSWMERNAPAFRDEASRATLREIREMPIKPEGDPL